MTKEDLANILMKEIDAQSDIVKATNDVEAFELELDTLHGLLAALKYEGPVGHNSYLRLCELVLKHAAHQKEEGECQKCTSFIIC